MVSTTATLVPVTVPRSADHMREHRSVMLLLSTTDPLGLIAGGQSSERYASTASTVLQVLRAGGGVDALFPLFLTAGERLEAVHAFTRAAVSWWASAEPHASWRR